MLKLKFKISSCVVVLTVLFLFSCSTKKNTFITRNYHNLNAHYNAYFNGKESFKEALAKTKKEHKDDYKKVLPIYIYPKDATSLKEELKRSIEKGSKVIHKHSIYIKKNEYCNWVDDAYLLIGKSNFYETNYDLAIDNFEYVSKKYRSHEMKFQGLMWLARTYIRQKDYITALEFIDIIKNDPLYLQLIETKDEKEERIEQESNTRNKKPKKVKYKDRIKNGNLKPIVGEFNALQANYYFEQNNFDKTIEHLKLAVENTKKKKIQKRYQFILAQLYQKNNHYEKAYPLFETVAKKGPSYEMEFNAKIQQAISSDVSSGNTETVKKLLNEMAEDGKNNDYLGQIYFALAEVCYKEGNTKLAIEFYKMSAQKSLDVENKSISYLRMSEMLYKEPDYVQASKYYDSTMAFIPKTSEHYQLAVNRQSILKQLTNNLTIVSEQDSLLKLSLLSPKELKNFIKEQEKKNDEQKKEDSWQRGIDTLPVPIFNTNNNNAWYFYNANNRQKGFSEFQEVWGISSLFDNWRRSTEVNNNFEANEILNSENDTAFSESVSDTKADFLSKIPKTDAELAAAHKKIQQALYAIALIYKDDIIENQKSIKTSNNLLDRYQTFELKPAIYYHLYRIYRDQKSGLKSSKYKSLLINEFPESEYSKILVDSQYLDKNKEVEIKEEKEYVVLYQYYLEENFLAIYDNLPNIEEKFTLAEYQSKAYYLKALSIQKLKGVEAYKKALQLLVYKFPTSEVSEIASEALGVLK